MRVSDAVYSNLRGDQPRKLGLTYEQLRHIKATIVCCSLSGFGMTGPRASEGGYDYMMQGLAGWQMLTGDPDGPPTKKPCLVAAARQGELQIYFAARQVATGGGV